MKVTVTCPSLLRSEGSTAMIHHQPLPSSQIRKEKRIMEGKEKMMMRGKDLLTTLLAIINIQMVVATTDLAKPCRTTVIANPFHPGVVAGIMPLRDPKRRMPAHRKTPMRSKRMWH